MKQFRSVKKHILKAGIAWLVFFFYAGGSFHSYAVTQQHLTEQDREALKNLDPAFAAALQSMYDCKPQRGTDGKLHPIKCQVRTTVGEGMAIYNLCRKVKPKHTLEVGFAYGFSTLYFLAAIRANGIGRHVALDPFEMTDYHGIGLQKVREVGMEEALDFREEFDYLALPALQKEGIKFDVIFIDGNHRFDDVLLDFTLSDYLCAANGYIILHDMWMPSIQRAVSFITTNRSDYRQHPSPVGNISIFQKIGTDTRSWDHYVEF